MAVKRRANFPVAAIGASAGALETFRALLPVLPAQAGIAYILVQHLGPTYPSMLVHLLSSLTRMPVLEVLEGMVLEPDHVYVVPAGRYLAMRNRAFHFSRPPSRDLARMPF